MPSIALELLRQPCRIAARVAVKQALRGGKPVWTEAGLGTYSCRSPLSKSMNNVARKTIVLEKHKDIARIDQPEKRTYGWYVRVRFGGKTFSKFFSDKKCGGRYSSLLSALAWRDNIEEKLGKLRTDKHIVTVSHTDTGVVGVRLNDRLNRYEVSWVTPTGKQGKTSVSINRHGREEAFAIACRIRQEKESARHNG